MAFAHLHLHTEYSLLDGACRIKPLVKLLKEKNFKSCAVTDHGSMYGVIPFYKECKANGIKPVIGVETYLCHDRFSRSVQQEGPFHLILLCENNEGYKNLMKLVSISNLEGFYYRPRIDFDALKQHHEGLIALSACLSGAPSAYLLQNQHIKAKEHVLFMQDIMGKGNYFIEIMDHGIHEEKQVLPGLVQLSIETGIPLVATNDCHYLNKQDAHAQEVLMCIQTGKTIDEDDRMRMTTDELYVKSEEEMLNLFPDMQDAIDMSQKIADRCNVEIDFSNIHLPSFPTANGESADEMLRRLCEEGFKKRYSKPTQKAKDRLLYELKVIEQMGYQDYFLIVWDFISYAKSQNIMVGPGRGSAAGSMVAYCLDITQLDPIKYNLLFERFLNPDRVTMPDIDVDFCFERRQEVIDYVALKYGKDHVSQIITFGTMAARGVLRDVGRVLGYSYKETDRIAKMVPTMLGITLESALKINPEFKAAYDNEERVTKLVDTSLLLEGMPRHAGTHAAGVLITKEPTTNYVPLQLNDGAVTTQYPMGDVEALGLLKMDFLGLRTLTVIRDTLDLLKNRGVFIKAEDIPLDDKPTYDMISRGDTAAVFQLEGSGMRSFLTSLQPQSFEDIIAAISLYRPGPMDFIPRYLKGRENRDNINYTCEQLKPILEVTYGCIVYQEQVMQIVRKLAGYSLGRADLVRRAMSKKKHDVMDKERHNFLYGIEEENIPGAIKNGISKEDAEHIFDEMAGFASYAFNKSHAAAYGVISVRTAYLKCHYPAQYLAAVMSSFLNNSGKIASYIQHCRKNGIDVLPPHVNESQGTFTVEEKEGKECIRFGLSAIKGLGEKAVESIIQERNAGGPYRSIYDFCRRQKSEQITKRAVEGLVKAGCFKDLGANRNQQILVYEQAMESQSQRRRNNIKGQMSLFDMASGSDIMPKEEYPDVPECHYDALLQMEKEMTGVYISGHPLENYMSTLEALDFSTQTLEEISDSGEEALNFDGKNVTIGGLVSAIRTQATKRGQLMSFLTLEDLYSQVECILFPRVHDRFYSMLNKDDAVLVYGKLSVREDEDIKIIVDNIKPIDKAGSKEASSKAGAFKEQEAPSGLNDVQLAKLSKEKLFLKTQRSKIQAIMDLFKNSSGDVPVYLNLADEGITLLAPRKYWCASGEQAKEALANMLPDENIKVVINNE